ncbi:MAG: Rid family detoxifying hydrolase [Gemmatimonadaceae bacterium]
MKDIEVIHAAGAPKAIGPYSAAIRAGDFLYCSGQTPLDPATGELIQGDVSAQTRRVLQNLRTVLRAAGADWPNVVKSSVFLIDMGDFAAMNAAYAGELDPVKPARTTVAVRELPRGARVEIDMVAYLPATS